MEVERLHVTASLQIRLQGNAAFITLQEGEIRQWLAAALPTSADRAKSKNEAKRHLEKGSSRAKCRCCTSPATSFCLSSTFRLHVSIRSPRRVFVTLTRLICLSCFYFLPSLVLTMWEHEVLTILHRLEVAFRCQTTQVPQGPKQKVFVFYMQCFLQCPCSQAARSSHSSFTLRQRPSSWGVKIFHLYMLTVDSVSLLCCWPL